jgi:hypothetical protein
MSEAPFVIESNDTTVAEGGNSTPLPVGTKVLASLLPTNKEGTSIVKRPLAKQGENSAIWALAARFRIDDGQPGAGRNLFADIPLARNLKSTSNGKYPAGTPAFFFFQFFRALGFDLDNGLPFTLPDDHALMGQKFELVLGIDDSDPAYEPRNRVQFINKASGIPNNVGLKPYVGRVGGATAGRVAPAAQPGWTPGGIPAAAALVAQASVIQAGPPPGWTPPAYNPASDVQAASELALAGAEGKQF